MVCLSYITATGTSSATTADITMSYSDAATTSTTGDWTWSGDHTWVPTPIHCNIPEPVSEEDRLAQLEALGERARERIARRQRDAEAAARAEDLLRSLLGQPEYDAYRENEYLDVPSQNHEGWTYRLRPHEMIDAMFDGVAMHQLCIHTEEWVPEADDIISKMLLAQHDEDRLLATANRHRARRL